MSTETDIEELRIENTRLIQLLELHGIEWRIPEKIEVEPEPIRFIEAEPFPIGTAEKIAIFQKLFRGRTDIYPVRWESKTTGKSGYGPLAKMSGCLEFVKSPASNVQNVAIAN